MRLLFPATFRAMAIGFAGIVFSLSGCGGDPPKTESQLAQDAKVESMLAEGKSIRQIRANIKGEPDPTTVKKKKTARRK